MCDRTGSITRTHIQRYAYHLAGAVRSTRAGRRACTGDTPRTRRDRGMPRALDLGRPLRGAGDRTSATPHARAQHRRLACRRGTADGGWRPAAPAANQGLRANVETLLEHSY